MSAVWYRFRADARQRWRAWLVLALVVGMAGGSVVALVAGGRRTRSAYQRFLVAQDAFDVMLVSGIEGIFDIAELDLGRIATLPQVADAAPLVAMGAVARTPGGEVITADTTNFYASPGDRFGGALNRRKLLEGRVADPTRADEMVVGFDLAEQFELDVGDVLATNFIDAEEAASTFGGGKSNSVLPLLETEALEQLRVVGIAAAPGEFPPTTGNQTFSSIALTPAALAAHPDNFNVQILAVTLHGGPADVPTFLAEVEAITPGGSPTGAFSQQQITGPVQGGLDSLAGALTLSASLAGVVATLLVGQALVRQADAEAGDEPTLRSLGLTLGQVGLLRLGKAGAIAAAGALVSVAVALALSPLFPVGLARVAEPDPGVDADGRALLLGAAAVLAVTVALVAASAWRARRAAGPAGGASPLPRPSRLAATLAGVGAPAPAVAGALLATEPGRRGPGRTLRSSVATVALGVATVLGTATFAASLDRLDSTPALYGWTWDEAVGNEFATAFDAAEVTFLESSAELASVAVGTVVDVAVDGVRVSLEGAEVVKGSVTPALLSGAAPTAADELVLGTHVLEDAEIGEALTVTLAGREATFELVGRAVLPLHDAFTTFEGLQRISPGLRPQHALVSYTVDADRPAFRDRAMVALALDEADFLPATLPGDLVNFGGADAALVVVAALMAVVAVTTLAHTVLLATRRRRHDVAVLRVLGFSRRQTLGTVAWLAAVLVVAALAVAVPVGIAAGRLSWLGFAGKLGVVPLAVVPAPAVVTVVGISLAVALLTAAAPAWRAARARPAAALRAE